MLLDNLDSFTFNLSHYLEGVDVEVITKRSNQFSSSDTSGVDAIVLSPGPSLPEDHPGMLKCIKQEIGKKPILGVCLGMQALWVYEGGGLLNQRIVKHGVQEQMKLVNRGVLLKGVEDGFQVGLYHSWVVNKNDRLDFEVLARNLNEDIMAIENVSRKTFGVQFHPESIMSVDGRLIVKNFVEFVKSELNEKA